MQRLRWGQLSINVLQRNHTSGVGCRGINANCAKAQPLLRCPPLCLQCLASATEGVRLAARIVDTPCNEMNTDNFLEVGDALMSNSC